MVDRVFGLGGVGVGFLFCQRVDCAKKVARKMCVREVKDGRMRRKRNTYDPITYSPATGLTG